MRIRSIKPAFWTDKTIARLSIGARLAYIGMWNLADDAGWFEWDIEEMAAQLFCYEVPKRRERDLARWAQELFDAGRVQVSACGHARIPTFTEHQHLSGRRTETHWLRHQTGDCPTLNLRKSAEGGGNPQQSAADRMVLDGMDRKVNTRASARDGLTPERMAADAG